MFEIFHPQSNASLTKLPTNCLNVFGHFVGVALKGLKSSLAKMHMTTFILRSSNFEESIICSGEKESIICSGVYFQHR